MRPRLSLEWSGSSRAPLSHRAIALGRTAGCSRSMPAALPEQVPLGAANTQTRDPLHPTELPFTRGSHRVIGVATAVSHRVERRQVGALGLLEPLVERP
jgi:hypothetical protein